MPNGFYLVDKPIGISSSFITIKLKKHLKEKNKFGHSGTLDPAASGLLVIGCGKATRFFQYLLQEKTYHFSVQFGVCTDTADLAGKIIQTDNKVILKEEILNVISKFLGKTMQTPNKFSAIKINGQRAYELARADLDFNMPMRDIYIHNLELVNFFENKADFIVSSKSGLYVRTLSEDIAKELGTIGVVTNLRRTLSNGFSLSMIKENTFSFNIGGEIINAPFAFVELNYLSTIYKTLSLANDDICRLINGQRVKTEYLDTEFAICVDEKGFFKGGVKIIGGIIFPLCMINI